MKAIMKTAPMPGAEMVEIPVPEIAPDMLLVKLKSVALCASDFHVLNYEASVRSLNLKMPFVMGHELFGEVIKVGGAVKGFHVGDLVASDSHLPCHTCHTCHTCRTGRPHLCTNGYGNLGRSFHGCFAEYMALPAVAAVTMPKNTPTICGPLMEPFGVAVHAVQQANLSGKSVLVLGLGTIGLMAVKVAGLLGAVNLIACTTNDAKRGLARSLGADAVVNSRTQDVRAEVMRLTGDVGVDVVIEMTGSPEMYNLGIDCLSYGGRMVCVGIFNESVTIENYTNRVLLRELDITGIYGRLMFSTWEIAKELIRLGNVDLAAFVGEVLPFDRFFDGVAIAKERTGRIVYTLE